MPLGKVAMAIDEWGNGVWEVSTKDEAATYSGGTGLGVLIFNSAEDLWITHWIDLSSGVATTVTFADVRSAIAIIEAHGAR